MTNSPNDLADWMRQRLPELNKRIDDGDGNALKTLIQESMGATRSLGGTREDFTCVSMIHASLFRHKRMFASAELEQAIKAVEGTMVPLATSIGVAPRFLAFFYLLHNPELNGSIAQFRPGKDEFEFWRINRQGTKNFKQAALNLLEARVVSADSGALAQLLHNTRDLFQQIVEWNRELAQSLEQAEFRAMTAYFSEVEVGGVKYRGVNAGDQPWSYIIDLMFGVNLKHVFELGIGREYPQGIITSAEAMEYELNNHSYLKRDYLLPEDAAKLDETIASLEANPKDLVQMIEERYSDSHEVMQALRDTMQTYLMTSNTHFGLAKKYVPVDAETKIQIGSSGTNIQKFLKDGLIDERAKVVRALEVRHPALRPSLNIVAG